MGSKNSEEEGDLLGEDRRRQGYVDDKQDACILGAERCCERGNEKVAETGDACL